MTAELEKALNLTREWDFITKKTPSEVISVLQLWFFELRQDGFRVSPKSTHLEIRKPGTGTIAIWEKEDVYIKLEKPDTDFEMIIEAVTHNLHIKTDWGPAKVEYVDQVVDPYITTEGVMGGSMVYLASPNIIKGHMLGYAYREGVNSLKSIITLVAG